MKITSEFLLAIAPAARSEIVAGIVAAEGKLPAYGISSADQVAYFFGQVAEETGGFTRLEENLYYTSTARLRQVWPSRFKSDADAAPYVRNPSKLANLVYNGRMGNRTGSNDGYDFRGSGDLQTTGRTAFAEVDSVTHMGCVADPSKIRTHPGALESACVFWHTNRLNDFVAAGDINGLTKRLNGGLTNLADRKLYTDRAKRAATMLAQGVPLPAGPDTSGWLHRGSTGPAVRALQDRLRSLGYYRGAALDSDFGAATDDAVRHFQTDKGLIVDGVVGEATGKALASATVSPIDPHTNPPHGPLEPVPVQTPDVGLAAIIGMLLRLIFGILSRKG